MRCCVNGCLRVAYCKKMCRAHYSRYKRNGTTISLRDPIKRFWDKVDLFGPIHPIHGQCWSWMGRINEDGYGKFDVDDTEVGAHRFLWETCFGQLPVGINVLHRCDNPSCVNLDHLFTGDQNENNQDKCRKGRQPLGEDTGSAKLSDVDVIEIRKRYVSGCRVNGAHQLARQFNVHVSTIGAIVSRRTWTHI